MIENNPFLAASDKILTDFKDITSSQDMCKEQANFDDTKRAQYAKSAISAKEEAL